eukprot:TRINITY_DN402_c0_g1_i14.p1 TRINITY_DN402_c0_g1~~TRINITY_DN402_c0_g1_i14.p1  ORF type:complete len:1062 (-),score=352.53 TRINITY_DN402_c0_g1_i14:167-3286(-)
MDNSQNLNNNNNSIDVGLYSRQIYVLSLEVLIKLSKTDVLVYGLSGLGVEVAKNVILAGPRSVHLYDNIKTSYNDLSSQYYLSEEDIGKERHLISQTKLRELNSHVQVKAVESSQKLDEEFLKKFNVVIVIDNNNEEELIRIGNICHNNKIQFIKGEIRGLFANIFVDFGEGFVVADTDGEEAEPYVISGIANGEKTTFTTSEESRIDFQTDDEVELREIKSEDGKNGFESWNEKIFKVKVNGAYEFEIDQDSSKFGKYLTGGVVKKIKKPRTIDFKSFENSLEDAGNFDLEDFSKFGSSQQLHFGFRALNKFFKKHGFLPEVGNNEHVNSVVEIAKELNNYAKEKQLPTVADELDEKIISLLAKISRGNLNPMAAFIGGVIAQEALKSTGKFSPINQWFYYDCREAIPNEFDSLDRKASNSRYDGQVAVFGKDIQKRISDLKLFLVGAGALGCELIKNFACMGLGCGENGIIHVTDLDTIEKSNLNRQFLFRPPDIGKMKSRVASEAAKVMNPSLKVHVYETPVGPNTEDTFNTKFWRGLDYVFNALDNLEARLYIDRCCLRYTKPLFESGTLGTKANTQVVVPHLTQNYGASADPPEKQIAVCTEKHFPYKIEHTVQFAKTEFERLFTDLPNEVNKFVEDPSFVSSLVFNNSINVAVKRDILENIVSLVSKKMTWEKCVEESRHMFEKNFNHKAKQLLYLFPLDAKDSEGAPFWAPPKRPPTAIEFDIKNDIHFKFIVSTSNLLAFRHGIPPSERKDKMNDIIDILSKFHIEPFKPKVGERVKVNEKDKTEEGFDDDEIKIKELIQSLPSRESISGLKFHSDKFEKDLDSNHHVDFVSCVANLRGLNYSITSVTRDKVKQIAGKIIPAIATNTCMITGLITLELYKYLEKKPLENYRNGYVNLAVPVFAFSEPLPPEKSVNDDSNRFEPTGYTSWDSIVINGDLTLNEIFENLEDKYNMEISLVSIGDKMLYGSYVSEHEKRKQMKITDVYKLIYNQTEIPKHINFFELIIVGDDRDNDDVTVNLATVRIFYKEPNN